jgi:uncharacterized protein YndB with AHSA1/START domain
MIENSEVKDGVLTMSCMFDANVSRVYQAWADPSNISQWMGPGTVTCESVDIDLQVGGKYRLAMRTDDGVMTAFGEYREIETDSKLVFTWQWENGSFTDSLVTLNFSEVEGQTRLQLIHTELPDQGVAEHHGQGWTGSLVKLEHFLAG